MRNQKKKKKKKKGVNTWFITSGLASRGSHLLAAELPSGAAIFVGIRFSFLFFLSNGNGNGSGNESRVFISENTWIGNEDPHSFIYIYRLWMVILIR